MTLMVGSLFSGVGGFDEGFRRAGFPVLWQCERDAQCRDVLRRNFPDVEVIYTDVRTVDRHLLAPVDILIGGFPCQDFSIAGRRVGLGGERGGLFWEFVRIIREIRPTLVVMENVPGLLSSHGGRDFYAALRALRECGAVDLAWRILDAQYFGVAQMRKRVFIVADFGGERAGEILALSEGLQGHPPPRRETGQNVAGAVETRVDRDRGDHTMPLIAHALTAEGADASDDGTGRGTPLVYGIRGTLTGRSAEKGGPGGTGISSGTQWTLSATEIHAVAFGIGNDTGYALRANASDLSSTQNRREVGGYAVRRLTPL